MTCYCELCRGTDDSSLVDDLRHVREAVKAHFTGEHRDVGDLVDAFERLIDLRVELALIEEFKTRQRIREAMRS